MDFSCLEIQPGGYLSQEQLGKRESRPVSFPLMSERCFPGCALHTFTMNPHESSSQFVSLAPAPSRHWDQPAVSSHSHFCDRLCPKLQRREGGREGGRTPYSHSPSGNSKLMNMVSVKPPEGAAVKENWSYK